MAMMKSSSLNPLASTFIPSNVFEAVANEASVFATERDIVAKDSISIRSFAAYYVKKIIEVKRERGEYSLTKSEMVSLIQKLICLQYKISNSYDISCIGTYLSDKIPNVVLLNLAECDESSGTYRTNSKASDLSTYRPPSQSILLVAFYGLYRHEQAFRPMLSLPHRPEALQDKVWSVTDKDLKLWNRSLARSCSCPPMFGYIIPYEFFGNLFKLSNPCSMKEIHMSCSEESENGNEYILQENVGVYPIVEKGFVDFEETVATRSDLCYYSEQLKAIVSSVYNMIDELEKCPEAEDLMDEGYECYENFTESLWNADISELNRPMIDEIEEDNDDHPLLDVENSEIEDEEVVSMEVKEMLRRSLSNESDTEITPSNCNPPCSVWCSKLEISDSLQNRTKSDSSAIGLLSETTEFLTGISSGADLLPLKHLKPSFRRSFSANDCDPSYDQKYKAKMSTSYRRDLTHVFKTKGRSDSWKDSDSGIMTQWSSQEDVFCEEESVEGFRSSDKAPMWNFFSGEDSLWKPLPASEHSRSMSHKRVRDLKRQTSSVN